MQNIRTVLLILFFSLFYSCQKEKYVDDSDVQPNIRVLKYADISLSEEIYQQYDWGKIVEVKQGPKLIGWQIPSRFDSDNIKRVLTIGTLDGIIPMGIWINTFQLGYHSQNRGIKEGVSINYFTGVAKRFNRQSQYSIVVFEGIRSVTKKSLVGPSIVTVTTNNGGGQPSSTDYIYIGNLGLGGGGESTYNNNNNGNNTNLEYINPDWTPDGPSVLPQMIESPQEWFDNLDDVSVNTQQLDNPCIVGIINNIGNLPNSISDAIKTVFEENVKLKVNFVTETGLGKPASTRVATGTPKYEKRSMGGLSFTNLEVTIRLDPSYFSSSTKPFLFSTILHELYHAYFLYRQAESVGSSDKEQKFIQDFSFVKPALITDGSIDFGSQRLHHEEMANKYIQQIITAVATSYPITQADILPLQQAYYPELTINNYYEALAWDGLNETRIWIDKRDDLVTKNWAKMLAFIASAEMNGTSYKISKTLCQ